MALFTFVLIFLLGFPPFSRPAVAFPLHSSSLSTCCCMLFVQFFFLFLFTWEKFNIRPEPTPNSFSFQSVHTSLSPFLSVSLALSPHRLIIHLLHKERETHTHTVSEGNICARFLLSSCPASVSLPNFPFSFATFPPLFQLFSTSLFPFVFVFIKTQCGPSIAFSSAQAGSLLLPFN